VIEDEQWRRTWPDPATMVLRGCGISCALCGSDNRPKEAFDLGWSKAQGGAG
jgi:hypothetical protein